MSAIFMSVPRALHMAYLMQAYDAAPESHLARIVRQCVEECDVWEPRKMKTVDFSGLSPLEIHAECAGIRGQVQRLLPELEHAVIRSRYGLTDYEDVDNHRRFFFDKDRADAFKHLAEKWAAPQFPGVDVRVLDMIVARVFASRHTTPITLRQLADAFGKSHTYYRKIANKVEENLIVIENRALDSLADTFKAECNGHSIV